MAVYTSTHTGQQVDSAITKVLELVNTSAEINSAVGKALKLDDIESVGQEVVDGTVYYVLWKVKPTDSNQVYGFAMHPTTGELTIIYNNKGTKTASTLLSTGDSIPNSSIDALFD